MYKIEEISANDWLQVQNQIVIGIYIDKPYNVVGFRVVDTIKKEINNISIKKMLDIVLKKKEECEHKNLPILADICKREDFIDVEQPENEINGNQISNKYLQIRVLETGGTVLCLDKEVYLRFYDADALKMPVYLADRYTFEFNIHTNRVPLNDILNYYYAYELHKSLNPKIQSKKVMMKEVEIEDVTYVKVVDMHGNVTYRCLQYLQMKQVSNLLTESIITESTQLRRSFYVVRGGLCLPYYK